MLNDYIIANGGQSFFRVVATGVADLISLGEVDVNRFAYESNTFYFGYYKHVGSKWVQEYVSLASDNNSFTIIDTVTLSE